MCCGVLQGSALGPLFVLLWVYDVSSDKFNFYRFVDETNILYENKDLKSLELIVNQELRKSLACLKANNLNCLNVKGNKIKCVILSPIQERLTYQPKLIIFNNEQNKNADLERKEFAKYFGVLIDRYLSLKHHVDHVGSCQ